LLPLIGECGVELADPDVQADRRVAVTLAVGNVVRGEDREYDQD